MTKILTQYKMSKSNSLQNSKVFVMRGNVIDIAVGVIIGGTFVKIISSAAADIITPIEKPIGDTKFSELRWGYISPG